MKLNFSSNTILNDEIKKKSIKKTESTRLARQTRDLGHDTGTAQ
jgi:hypothetical protein